MKTVPSSVLSLLLPAGRRSRVMLKAEEATAGSNLGSWIWRSLALGAAFIIPACQAGSNGAVGQPTGVLWNSQASSGANVGAPANSSGPLWVDPNSGLGAGQIGISSIITSTDLATYAQFNDSNKPPPFTMYIVYIMNLAHPLQTDTSSGALTERESELLGLLNGFRQQNNPITLPGFPGGPIPTPVPGPVQTAVLPGHLEGTQSCRAHCKHYAYFHPGPMPGESPNGPPAPGVNAEGDWLLKTNQGTPAYTEGTPPLGPIALKGRLGKIAVSAEPTWGEFSYSGVQWIEAIDVYNQMIQDDPATINGNWTNMADGHWRGGTQGFYWNIIFISNPNPSQ
jgi:hypothetical protein